MALCLCRRACTSTGPGWAWGCSPSRTSPSTASASTSSASRRTCLRVLTSAVSGSESGCGRGPTPRWRYSTSGHIRPVSDVWQCLTVFPPSGPQLARWCRWVARARVWTASWWSCPRLLCADPRCQYSTVQYTVQYSTVVQDAVCRSSLSLGPGGEHRDHDGVRVKIKLL